MDGAGLVRRHGHRPGRHRRLEQPALSTLVTAVTKAGLVDSLNTRRRHHRVRADQRRVRRAPDKATLDKALGDPKGLLTTVLTYHVVAGQLSPADLAGTHKTLQGGTIDGRRLRRRTSPSTAARTSSAATCRRPTRPSTSSTTSSSPADPRPDERYGSVRSGSLSRMELSVSPPPDARAGATAPCWPRCWRGRAAATRRRSPSSTTSRAARVFGLARRVVRDPAQAEEVAQEAYLEIWRQSARFDAGTRIGAGMDAHDRAPPGRRPGAVGGERPASATAGTPRSATARSTTSSTRP